jgi:hypothetical protein
MENIDNLISDLDETVYSAEFGANIGGAPCGALFIVVYVFAG